uniref:Uncharacterized protein n=1 Tax=Arundo donax TaxID=35708 RepID=A0A0A9F916_ARUDO
MYTLHWLRLKLRGRDIHSTSSGSFRDRKLKKNGKAEDGLSGEETVEGRQAEAGLGRQLPELHRDVDPHPGRRGGGGLHPRSPHLGHRPEVPTGRLAAAFAVSAGGSSIHPLFELLRDQ